MKRLKRANRAVLLLEPDYANKYPPVGLMKLATYYRRMGWDVTFYKGDLNLFVAQRLTLHLVEELDEQYPDLKWGKYFDVLLSAVWKKESKKLMDELMPVCSNVIGALQLVSQYQKEYRTGGYFGLQEWDRVGVTTLFTFYAKETIETINFAKKLTSKENIMVGGVMASLVPDYIEKETGIKPSVGLLQCNAIYGDHVSWNTHIDDLPLDYSILEEVDYSYPASDAYFAHTTRGCVNKCAFCAVPVLEPKYLGYVPLVDKINYEKKMFGPKQHLLLMDNNVFASKDFFKIIDDIKKLGFAAGDKVQTVNPLLICRDRVREHYNDKAFIRSGIRFLRSIQEKIKNEEELKTFSEIIKSHDADMDWHGVDADQFLNLCGKILPIVEKHWRPSNKGVTVDYNQGLDSRLSMRQGIMNKLAECAIRPVRIAFDHWELRKVYEDSIRMAAKAGIRQMSNYVLYNFHDTPEELYWRLRLNVALCEDLDVSIYSFPMKYHPIKDPAYFSNRDFLGEHWCRKYIRFIQLVLNSTMGKIGRGKSFFLKAFGETTSDFREMLLMPEYIIRSRFDCEACGETDRWRDALRSLNAEDEVKFKERLVYNDFAIIDENSESKQLAHLLSFYKMPAPLIKKISDEQRKRRIGEFDEKWKDRSARLSEADIALDLERSVSWKYAI